MDKPKAPPELVTAEEWESWLSHPVTKLFRSLLLLRREDIKERCITGEFTDQVSTGNALLYGKAIGTAEAFADILDLEPAVINSELSHEE